tara:strand:+ start:52 stop:432 length:381 start_codon:yes stop_codon:yes gene_type:complete
MKENDLFIYLKKYWSDLEMSKDKYSKHDCYSRSTETRIELKCRNKHYNELMLERSKYIYLMVKHILYDEKPLYINSTPKGVYCFDLRKAKPIWIIDNRMPISTEFKNTEKIKKEYCLLSIDKSNKV